MSAKTKQISFAEECKAITAYQRGKTDALNVVIRAYEPLLEKWAKSQHRRNRAVDLDDYMQAGFEGLIKAAKKFDPDRGYRFGTFMRWEAINAMSMLAQHSRVVSIDYSTAAKKVWFRLRKECDELSWDRGRLTQAQYEYLAEALDVDLDTLRATAQLLASNEVEIPANDGFQEDENGGKTASFIPVQQAEQHEYAEQQDLLRRVVREIRMLPEREYFVIECRFFRTPTLSLQNIADALNITKERVRQIEAKALKRLESQIDFAGSMRDLPLFAGAFDD